MAVGHSSSPRPRTYLPAPAALEEYSKPWPRQWVIAVLPQQGYGGCGLGLGGVVRAEEYGGAVGRGVCEGCAGCVQSSLSGVRAEEYGRGGCGVCEGCAVGRGVCEGCAVGVQSSLSGVRAEEYGGAGCEGCAGCAVGEGCAGARGVQWARSGCARGGCARWDGECVRGVRRWAVARRGAREVCAVCGGRGGCGVCEGRAVGEARGARWVCGGAARGAGGVRSVWCVQSSLSGVRAEEYGGAGCAVGEGCAVLPQRGACGGVWGRAARGARWVCSPSSAGV